MLVVAKSIAQYAVSSIQRLSGDDSESGDNDPGSGDNEAGDNDTGSGGGEAGDDGAGDSDTGSGDGEAGDHNVPNVPQIPISANDLETAFSVQISIVSATREDCIGPPFSLGTNTGAVQRSPSEDSIDV